MTTSSGFTLVEIVVVLAVLGILVGTAAPLVGAAVDRGRRDEAERELAVLAEALEAYYYEQGAFPKKLDGKDFVGVYLSGGVNADATTDPFGGAAYRYALAKNPDVATVTSLGPNARDDKGKGDDLRVTVPGATAGNRRTRARLRVMTEVLANFLESGGALSGKWSKDRKTLGLGASYAADGFGTAFRLDKNTYEFASAGADRRFGTKDDLGP